MSDGRWDLRTVLLAALLASCILRPPELSPTGLALAVTLAGGAAALLLCSPGRSGGIRMPGRVGAAVLSGYLLVSVAFSPQPHRSLSFLMGAAIGLVAFVAARGEAARGSEKERERVLNVVIGAASLAAAHGVYQKLFGLARTARDLRARGQPELDPYILRAESGRAFGPFALPSALGICLALAIPLTLRLWLRCRPGGRGRILAGLLLALQAAGMGASVSYGAVASLVAAAVLLLPFAALRRKLPALAGVLVIGAFALGLSLATRAEEGASPLVLRILNWRAAVQVLADEPLLGVGFGNFSDAYARYLGPGMNETAYVHNSYLQVAAEGGLLALGWILLSLTTLASGLRRRVQAGAGRLEAVLLVLPSAVFLLHNLVDFSAYLPSLSTVFAALAGLAWQGSGAEHEEADRSPAAVTLRTALLLLAVGGSAWGLREARSRLLIEQGREHLARGGVRPGIRILERAARWDPGNPDPPGILAEAHLHASRLLPEGRGSGEAWARKAVALRPRRAYGHYLLSIYRLAAGDAGAAWVEISRARRLHPGEDLYRQEESRLRAMLQAGPKRDNGGTH